MICVIEAQVEQAVECAGSRGLLGAPKRTTISNSFDIVERKCSKYGRFRTYTCGGRQGSARAGLGKVRGDAPKYPATTAEEHVRRKLELAAGVIG